MNGTWFKFINYCQNKFKIDIEIPINSTRIRMVDAAHVCICDVVSNANNLAVSGVSDGFIKFDKNRVKAIKYDKKSVLSFTTDGVIVSISSNTGIKDFAVGSYNTGRVYNEPIIPPLADLPGQFIISYDELDAALGGVGKMSDYVILTYTTTGILSVKAREPGNNKEYKIIYQKDIPVKPVIPDTNGTTYVSMFPLDYLKDIIAANLTKSDMSISMTNHYPIKIEWDMDDGVDKKTPGDKHHITWYLAPRIESDY